MAARKFLYENGLSVALFSCFAVMQIGLSIVGLAQYNETRLEHLQPTVTYLDYIFSGEFLGVTMENWESEFLQMFAYVVFTAYIFQKGSAESKAPGEVADVDADPRLAPLSPHLPWPVRRGGIILKLYENSLGITLFLLFLISFFFHALGSEIAYNQQQLEHGKPPITFWEHLISAQFWFESLQNWQSEFFSVGMMVVLSIYLRQRGSPESKPVAMAHHENP